MCKGKIREVLKKRWQDVEYFGEGGNSYVFKATHEGQPIAIKVFRRFNSPERYPRFTSEIITMSNLRGMIGIVEVIDFNQTPEKPKACDDIENLADLAYYVMKLYPINLAEKLSTLTTDDGTIAVKIMLDVAKAVKGLHNINYAHRDLKPENILIDDNNDVAVSDFGLSIDLNNIPEPDQRLSGGLELIGSVSYRAPELLRGRLDDSDHRPSDIFALGRILWALIYRREPNSITDIEFSKMTISNYGNGIKNANSLDYIIADATKFDPKFRSNIDDFIEGLDLWLKPKGNATSEYFIEKMLNDPDNQSKGKIIRNKKEVKEQYNEILAAIHRRSEELIAEWKEIANTHIEKFGFGNFVEKAQMDHFLDFCRPEILGIETPLTVNCDGVFIKFDLQNNTKYPELILAIYFELNYGNVNQQKYCIIPAYIPVNSSIPVLVKEYDVKVKEFDINKPNIILNILSDFENSFNSLDSILKKI